MGDMESLKRTRAAVFLSYFFLGFVFSSWASRIPEIKTALGLSDGQFGKVLFAMPVGQLLCLQVSGKLVGRLGSRAVLPIALPVYAIGLVLLGLAPNPTALAAALFLFGVLGNLASIAINTQGVLTEKLFGRSIMASFHGGWSTAGFAGGLVGLLVVNLHLTPWIHFALVLALVTAVVVAIRNSLVPGASVPAPAQAGPKSRDPWLLQLGLIGFCSMATEGAMFDWSGVYFKDVVHAPASLVVLGYTSFMVMMASGRFLGDRVLARLGRRDTLRLSGVVMSAGLFASVLFPQMVPCALAFMVVGLGVSNVIPSVYSLAGQSPNHNPSVALATVSSVSFLGFLMGPPLIGTVAAYSSLRYSYAIIACFGLGVTLLVSRSKLIEVRTSN
jgi:MFS family permease